MPTYEYLCNSCGHTFEEVQRITEPPLDTCTKCGQKSAERQISAAAFLLQGKGWYTTDYAGKKVHGDKVGEKAQKEDNRRSDMRTKELAESKAKADAASAPNVSSSTSSSSGSSGSSSGGD